MSTANTADGKKYRCVNCGSEDVELAYPAWFAPNDEFKFVEADTEADELYIFCNECEESNGIISPHGYIITGIC